ncbi:MAG: aminomethyl-transferring glycine dehydrogenase subunit GcvPB, partial [Candidatus Aerophobetes bacterium]|nr:aminomethyl-transferring glycine dehydrogenase subunit GcvPB [Candidatus Aerophobetes bacterium]
MTEPLIFEKSRKGRKGYSLPERDVDKKDLEKLIPREYLRKSNLGLPRVSEIDVVRHFTRLSQKNIGIDTNFYPLGSCTMKYNPKVNEDIAHLPNFMRVHPYQPIFSVQGTLQILYEMERLLCEISGMTKVSLQPAAGAHGERTSMMIAKDYYQERGEKRDKVLIPDSAHGTNPASSHLCGFQVVEVKSDPNGGVDLNDLTEKISDKVAALMLTVPNTLGLFEENILKIAQIVHNEGGLLYLDGANLNAFVGIVKPTEFGVDIMHFNLHKTFSTPHGGGGPGSGPVGVKEPLVPYLPVPTIEKGKDGYYLDYNRDKSIGKVISFYGNVEVIIKAYCYLRSLGKEGLKKVSQNAVLNANYLMKKLKKYFYLPYDRPCMHEFVLSGEDKKINDVRTLDIAKRLLDFGFHPPTIYFPLIVKGALMIEPTETESKETLDAFASAMIQIKKEIEENPSLVKEAPHSLSVGRLDEMKAARQLKL